MRAAVLMAVALLLSACTPQEIVWHAFHKDGSPELHRQAVRIVECETGGTWNPRAHNPSGASGLFQVMPLHAADFERVTGKSYWSHRFDPLANVTYAKWLYIQTGDWRHWTCRKAL